ncbi:transposase [Actinopolyspora lacussalsi]|uniref:transposase n=1 Tax=Actinopolyspora righensis TaxID=995060 RepID=UPI00318453DD
MARVGVRAVTDARRNSVAECDGADSRLRCHDSEYPDSCRIFGSNTTDRSNDSIPKISLPVYCPRTITLVDTAFSGRCSATSLARTNPAPIRGVPAPHLAVSKPVNSLTDEVSRRDKQHFRARNHRGLLSPPSYFVNSCGGAPLRIVRQYARNQWRPT